MIHCGRCGAPFPDDVDAVAFDEHYQRCGGEKNMKLILNGEVKRQYVVNWELNGEGKGEVFDTRAGLFKQVRQLKAVGIPFSVTRTTLSQVLIEGN